MKTRFLTVLLIPLSWATGASAIQYTITDLGRGQGVTINDAGQVVVKSGSSGFIWQNGITRALIDTTNNLSLSEPYAINESGIVVGAISHVPAIWNNGVITQPVPPVPTESAALAINDLDQVVGYIHGQSGATYTGDAFLWQNGVLSPLVLPGAIASNALGNNNAGQIVGWTRHSDGSVRAFVWQNDIMNDLGPGVASAINEAGDVIGWTKPLTGNTTMRAFLWKNGSMIDLGTPGGPHSFAYSINNNDQIVGVWGNLAGRNFPFLWQDGIVADLNTFLPLNSRWYLTDAFGINNSGQIVGYGHIEGDGYLHAFLMTPIPEPGTLSLFALGVLLIRRIRKRGGPI